jgi:hypothetical protein
MGTLMTKDKAIEILESGNGPITNKFDVAERNRQIAMTAKLIEESSPAQPRNSGETEMQPYKLKYKIEQHGENSFEVPCIEQTTTAAIQGAIILSQKYPKARVQLMVEIPDYITHAWPIFEVYFPKLDQWMVNEMNRVGFPTGDLPQCSI